jgi:hypothetical protein
MRYFTPTSKDYQSTFVPTELPFELMLKSLDNKQQTYNTAQSKIDETSKLFKVDKGLSYDKTFGNRDLGEDYRKQLDQINEQMSSGKKDPSSAAREAVKLYDRFQNDEDVKIANRDAAISKAVYETVARNPEALGDVYRGSQLGYNPINLKANGMPISEAEHYKRYGLIGNKDFLPEHADLEKMLVDQAIIDGVIGSDSNIISKDVGGKKMWFEYNKNNNTIGKKIDPTYFNNVIENYAVSQFPNSAKESVLYRKKQAELGMRPYGVVEYADELKSNLLGKVGTHEYNSTGSESLQALPGQTFKEKEEKLPTQPTQYPRPGDPTQRGIKNTKTFTTNLSAFLNKTPAWQPPAGNPMTPPPPGALTSVVNWKDLPQENKNLIGHYFELEANKAEASGKGSPNTFRKWSQDIKDGKDMQWLQNSEVAKKMQKDMSDPVFLKRMEAVDIRNNNTIETLPFEEEAVYSEINLRHDKDSAPTLSDFLVSALAGNKAYNKEAGEAILPGTFYKRYESLSDADKKNIKVSVNKYRPENNFKLSIGDGDNWANSYEVNIGGETFVAQAGRNLNKRGEEIANEIVNDIHTSLVYGFKGSTYKLGNDKYTYNDDDPSNPYFINLKTNEIYESATDIYNDWVTNKRNVNKPTTPTKTNSRKK